MILEGYKNDMIREEKIKKLCFFIIKLTQEGSEFCNLLPSALQFPHSLAALLLYYIIYFI